MTATQLSLDLHAVKEPPEEWRPIADYVGLYEVSSWGRVRSLDAEVVNRRDGGTRSRRGRVLRFKPRKDGYLGVSLSKNCRVRDFSVHSLVARTFVPNPLGLPEVNHIDFDRQNNRATNLEWTTSLGNSQHSKKAGRTRNGQAKLTPDDVREIRRRLAQGQLPGVIGAHFGVGRRAITKIKLGQRWQHLL